MMRNFGKYLTGLLLTGFFITGAFAQTIPFDSDRWEINAVESRSGEFFGRKGLLLRGGDAIIKDSDFTNGIIEYDVLTTGERGFLGAVWRLQDLNNYEEFYIRPHQSGNPDANQYTPVFNGMAGWQLYHGQGYGAPMEYPFNEWMHVQIAVSGKSAEVYINDMEKPLLYVPELKRDIKSGKVGVEANSATPAYFSNFKFIKTNPVLKGKAVEPKTTPDGTVFSYLVSNVFEEKSLTGKYKISAAEKSSLTWKKLNSESTGITNLARLNGIDESKNTVFVKLTVLSDKAQVKKISFGYSDRIKVYFNDVLIYGGTNFYSSRDYRYLGTIGLFDELFLQLKEGENSLWMAVSESFGGWGIMAQFEDMEGIKIVNK
ncbi:hypothetical protein ACFL4T_09585 [candidate division KSB1 bacterium]